jgi:hypothetical protein
MAATGGQQAASPRAESAARSVKDAPYHAKGDGVADDTAAIQQAIDDAGAGSVGAAGVIVGGVVSIPPGVYNVSSLVIRGPGPVTIQGAGPGSTVLRALNRSGDVVTVRNPYTHIREVAFRSAGRRTGGAYVNFTKRANLSSLRQFEMWGAYLGVRMASTAGLYVEYGAIREIVPGRARSETTAGILVTSDDTSYTSNDHYIRCVTMDNPDDPETWPSAGIWINSTGAINLTDCDIIHCNDDLYIADSRPVVGQGGGGVYSVYAVNCYFDSARVGIYIRSGQAVQRCHFVGCWTCSHLERGVDIDVRRGARDAHHITNIAFVGHQSCFNGSDGLLINGVGLKVADGDFIGNSRARDGLSGVVLGPHARGCIVTGNTIGSAGAGGGAATRGYGVFVTAGASGYIIANNDLTGNSHGGLVQPNPPPPGTISAPNLH